MDRSEEFRSAAAECLALIHTTTDASSRARLLTMAQKWFAWADGACGGERLESVLREFNDEQIIPH
jgi:site-specific recombinase